MRLLPDGTAWRMPRKNPEIFIYLSTEHCCITPARRQPRTVKDLEQHLLAEALRLGDLRARGEHGDRLAVCVEKWTR